MTPTQSLKAAIKAQILAALPALVAAAGLPAIVEVLGYWPAIPVPTKVPQVFVTIKGSHKSDAAKDGSSMMRYAEMREFYVGITNANNDPEAATTDLEGYADLVRQAIEGSKTAGGTSLKNRWLKTDFSPNFAQGNGLYQEAVLTFEASRQVIVGVQ